MKTIPPYHANPDGVSCGQCVYRMMLEHFRPEEDWPFERMNEICGAVPGKWTWSFKPVAEFIRMGFEVREFGIFDVAEFLKDPPVYMEALWGPEGAKAAIENSDMERAIEDAHLYQNILDQVDLRQRIFNADDLREALDEEFLIDCWVNSSKLNGKDGYAGHFILIYDYDDKGFYVHDPGGKVDGQIPSRYISEDDLIDAASPQTFGETDSFIAVRDK